MDDMRPARRVSSAEELGKMVCIIQAEEFGSSIIFIVAEQHQIIWKLLGVYTTRNDMRPA